MKLDHASVCNTSDCRHCFQFHAVIFAFYSIGPLKFVRQAVTVLVRLISSVNAVPYDNFSGPQLPDIDGIWQNPSDSEVSWDN